MKTEIKIAVNGFVCVIPPNFPKMYLECSGYRYDTYLRRKVPTKHPIYILNNKTKERIVGLGILSRIVREYSDIFDFTIKIKSHRPIDFNIDELKERFSLRDYQVECLREISFSRGGIIRLPTGSGKGTIATSLASALLPYGDVLILTPNNTVKNTMISRLDQFNVPYMDYNVSRDVSLEDPYVFVTNPVSLINDYKSEKNVHNREGIKFVLSDECHHLSCDSWSQSFLALPNVERSYGFSATVFEHDDSLQKMSVNQALMISFSGEIIYNRSAKDPEIAQYLDIPDIYEIPFYWTLEIKTNSWLDIARLIENNIDRHKFIASIINELSSLNLCSLSVVAYKASAEHQYKYIDHKSIKWFGSGDIYYNDENRIITFDEVMTLFGSKDGPKSIIATNHINEGVDIPILDAIIMSENVNPRLVVQRSGRTVRKGGLKSLVINIIDKNGGVLENHSYRRTKTLINEFGGKVTKVESLQSLKASIIERLERDSS